MLLYFVIKH